MTMQDPVRIIQGCADSGRVLDLFCGAGGAATGYNEAGFDVVGIDHAPQKNYPFTFVNADVFDYLAAADLSCFDAIHASPPCQRYSHGTPDPSRHPDLLDDTRRALRRTGLPYVIENVPGAPMRADILICGCMVGLPLIRRRRLFECSWRPFVLMPPCTHEGPVITVTGHGTTSGNRASWGRNIRVFEMRAAMGINWTNRDELSQAVPPAYTRFIGSHLLDYLDRTNA